MTYYYERQEQLIAEGMVEVQYTLFQRPGCSAVRAYEYYKTLRNAQRRARTIAKEAGTAVVADFAGYCELF